MNALLLPALALLLAYAAMGGLCLAMERHYAQWRGRGQAPPAPLRRWLRLAAVAALATSYAACIADSGFGAGSVLWCGALSAAALPLVWLWAYSPRAALRTVACALVLALLAALALAMPR